MITLKRRNKTVKHKAISVLGLLLTALFSTLALGSSGAECKDDPACIAENSWQIGIAVGVGGRTNPLVDGDTIPLVIVPDIAYYAESAYFDNGELGWQFTPSASTSVELFVAPNFEKANFNFWHTANLFISSSIVNTGNVDVGEPTQGPNQDQVSVDEIESRKWALDAGLRWQWLNRQHQLSISVAHDITNVYQGAHASLQYQYRTGIGNWHVTVSPHLKWHSDALTNYYYGIRTLDTDSRALTYTASGGFQYGFSLYTAYQIDQHWHGLFRASITRLHSGMTDSPLVEDSSIYSAFAGIAYRF